jgi:hypothetical protein
MGDNLFDDGRFFTNVKIATQIATRASSKAMDGGMGQHIFCSMVALLFTQTGI